MATNSKTKKRGNPAPGSVTGKETKIIREKTTQKTADQKPKPTLPELLALCTKLGPKTAKVEDDSDTEVVELKFSSPPTVDQDLLKGFVKSMFKADHPYRTKLGYFTLLQTSGSGLTNVSWPVSALSSAGEWASLNSLFDEVFIHSMSVHFIPRNRLDGAFAFTPTAQTAPVIQTSGASTTTTIWNCGLIMACLFAGTGNYTSATAMISCPNHKIAHTAKPFKYNWRNNVRFDPRGQQDGTTNTQGWMLITSVGSNYGGFIQFRTVNDVTVGTGASAITFGDMATVWDVSFRSRA